MLAIFGMIGFKAMEIRSGKKSWISRIAESTNHIFHNIFAGVRKFISYLNRKSAIALIQWIAYHILSWARELYIWAYKKAHAHGPSKTVIDMVRGRGHVTKKGGVSFYLKRIAEHDQGEVKKEIQS